MRILDRVRCHSILHTSNYTTHFNRSVYLFQMQMFFGGFFFFLRAKNFCFSEFFFLNDKPNDENSQYFLFHCLKQKKKKERFRRFYMQYRIRISFDLCHFAEIYIYIYEHRTIQMFKIQCENSRLFVERFKGVLTSDNKRALT